MNSFEKDLKRTWAEKKGRKPFNWLEALESVTPTQDQTLGILKAKAGDWPTCACGNQCAILERYVDGEPKDPILAQLGIKFYENVANMWWDVKGSTSSFEKHRQMAISIFHQIESRSFKLINQTVFIAEVQRLIIDPLKKEELREYKRNIKKQNRPI